MKNKLPSSELPEKRENDTQGEEKPKKAKSSKKKPKKALTEKEKTIRAARRLLIKIIVVAAIIAVLLVFVGGVHVSHNINMFPAVADGDLAITYKLGGYYNGDIVVYEVDGIKRFGRVVGIPGDEIDISEDGHYTINGSVPYETIYFSTHPADQSNITYPYRIQDGEVFILNDLRDDATDSRIYGGISNLKGKVVLLIRRRGF